MNSVGALEYAVANGYRKAVELRPGLLAPSMMGFAVPPGSSLLLALDISLVKITSSIEWASREAAYFAK